MRGEEKNTDQQAEVSESKESSSNVNICLNMNISIPPESCS